MIILRLKANLPIILMGETGNYLIDFDTVKYILLL
jgi:hypothetical protein